MSESYYETPESPFREALKAITGKDAPEFVKGYSTQGLTDQENQDLQDWCSDAVVEAGFEWMTGLGVIEAAELLVDGAVENGNIARDTSWDETYLQYLMDALNDWEKGCARYDEEAKTLEAVWTPDWPGTVELRVDVGLWYTRKGLQVTIKGKVATVNSKHSAMTAVFNLLDVHVRNSNQPCHWCGREEGTFKHRGFNRCSQCGEPGQ